MDDKEGVLSVPFPWEKAIHFATRREIVVTSLIGLCGIGVFWQTRRWLAMTPFEEQLLKEYGISVDMIIVDESNLIKEYTAMEEVGRLPLRIFFSPHLLSTKLPRATPLIVFVHGLGGQINQFEPLLRYFGQVADVLALDLPGCGKSPFVDRQWEHYTTDALANLVGKVIEERIAGRKVVLVGHSLGCMVTGTLALKMGDQCLAMVLLCPKAEITEKEERGRRFLAGLPEFMFNIFRKRDRAYLLAETHVRGGIHSASVRRMVGPNVSDDIRKQQLVWNLQSQTPTSLRMLYGARPPTPGEWHSLVMPTLVIAGEEV
jgi:pimeloyl-ACP methyl ester carboxylesterase